jgi:phage I-like protein
MTDRKSSLNASASAIALNFDGATAPEWVELIPAGPDVIGRDGRSWLMEDAQTVVDATPIGDQPLPLDWEHATEVRADKGLEAPAAGWIEELQVRDGAIWGRVAWTPRGGDQVGNREYRFLSPVFSYGKDSRRIVRLLGAGLTNTPNLRLTALNREEPNREEEDHLSLATQLRTALGLAADADDATIIAAVNTAKAANKSASVDLTQFAPRSDLEAAVNRATTAEAALKAKDDAEHTAAIESELTAAQTAGKIAPASVEHYRAMCKAEGGLVAFKALVATMPVVASNKIIATDKKADEITAGSALTEEEKAVCRALGQDEATFKPSTDKKA